MLDTKKLRIDFKHSLRTFKENIRLMFSLKGIVNRYLFFIFFIFINAIFGCFNITQYFPKLSYITNIPAFYCILVLVQKRCRDFGSSGTFWILAISIAFVGNMAFHFVDVPRADTLVKNIYHIISALQVITFLFLFIIPSKPKPDLTLRSPLLKRPLLYTAICWVLAIISTIAVNNLVGITVL